VRVCARMRVRVRVHVRLRTLVCVCVGVHVCVRVHARSGFLPLACLGSSHQMLIRIGGDCGVFRRDSEYGIPVTI
jgi:hypothetical protein